MCINRKGGRLLTSLSHSLAVGPRYFDRPPWLITSVPYELPSSLVLPSASWSLLDSFVSEPPLTEVLAVLLAEVLTVAFTLLDVGEPMLPFAVLVVEAPVLAEGLAALPTELTVMASLMVLVLPVRPLRKAF